MNWNWVFTPSKLNKMIDDYNNIDKSYGWKAKLARRWNLDYRNVDRLIARIKKNENI